MKENKKEEIKIPNHVAIIMDGNRRWAKERNLPTFEGHFRGYRKLGSSVDWFFKRGVKIISFFGFSTENWNRSQEEVNYLMKLIHDVIDKEINEAVAKNYRVLVSGRIEELPGDLPEACRTLVDKTKTGAKGILNLCLNYGGRPEIIDAVRKMIRNGITEDQVHEGMIKKNLYNDLPDPDIIIRTSGEQRLSGFLLWQSAYSELFFMQKYWPDFEETDADIIINEYSGRQRRFGGN